MGIGDLIRNAFSSNSTKLDSKPIPCPSCKKEINLNLERCPNCGVRISSMFRKKCPKCKTLNEISANKCTKCFYDFDAESERAKKTYYSCPICGYKYGTSWIKEELPKDIEKAIDFFIRKLEVK